MPKLKIYVHVDGKQYGPDDDLPSEVTEKITNPDVWESAPADGGAKQPTNAELEAEIAKRNEGRAEADLIVPAGNKKADLVSALEADDAKSV